VATDGNPVPEGLELTKDTVLIAPGERYDLELIGDNPGVWMFHCHIENHADNGMMSLIAYEGSVPTGPIGATWTDGQGGMGHDGHTTTDPADPAKNPIVPEATTAPAGPTGAPAATGATGNGQTAEIAINDNSYGPTSLTVAPGTTVVWVNKGHNMHSVASFDGAFQSITLAPGETFSYTFTAPGEYRYVCKQHGRQGMLGMVVVQ
jgi:plastocyanin